ncbi:MAG: pyridoxal-5'-phosphate-dependent protein, partial [Verrucomicrobiota bacterium]
NMDFAQLGSIAREAAVGGSNRQFLRLAIPERKGSLVDALAEFPAGISIINLQYGRVDSADQFPLLGLSGQPEDYLELQRVLSERNVSWEKVDASDLLRFRVINYDATLFRYPLFVEIEFPERPGAFLEFMNRVREISSLCYFNYASTGERVGRALVGMDFDSSADRTSGIELVKSLERGCIRAAREIGPELQAGILGRSTS